MPGAVCDHRKASCEGDVVCDWDRRRAEGITGNAHYVRIGRKDGLRRRHCRRRVAFALDKMHFDLDPRREDAVTLR